MPPQSLRRSENIDLEWRNFYYDRGLSNNSINPYIRYVTALSKRGLPVIFEFEHLSKLLGINRASLARMVLAPESFYRHFSIAKRNGGRRDISAPHRSLLHIQRWILQNILERVVLNDAAHGFCKGRSIKTNALVHVGSGALLKMDLKSFFPSIPLAWVVNTFKEFGYAPNVAFYLASLCCSKGHLAQGAATSPALSNIIARSLDNRLAHLAAHCDLQYTRYADDLTFSGSHIHPSLVRTIGRIVSESGFNVNTEKTRLKREYGARIVTGLCVTKDGVQVPGKFKRTIKNEVHFIKRFGLLAHMANRKINNPKYLSSLLGRVNFLLSIEPQNRMGLEAREILSGLQKI